jgi:hypothetical protein
VLTQIDGYRFLGRIHRRLQMMCRMRAIQRIRALFPFVDRAAANAIALCQGADAFLARGNLCTHRRCRPGVPMQTKLPLLLLSLLSTNRPLPATHLAQKTVTSVKIVSNRPGRDILDVRSETFIFPPARYVY